MPFYFIVFVSGVILITLSPTSGIHVLLSVLEYLCSSLLVLVTGTGYWYCFLVLGTGTGYWYSLLVLVIGSVFCYLLYHILLGHAKCTQIVVNYVQYIILLYM